MSEKERSRAKFEAKQKELAEARKPKRTPKQPRKEYDAWNAEKSYSDIVRDGMEE